MSNSPSPAPSGRRSDDAAAALEAVAAFNRAFAANDPAAYFGRVHPDITVFTPSNPYRVEGLADDREEFEFSLRSGRTRIGYFQQLQTKVQVLGDAAVVTYHSRGSYGPADSARTAYLKETDVVVRTPEGWKVAHVHVSATG